MSLDFKKLNNLKKSVDSLRIKYDLFFSNRQYKNTHFKSEEEYLVIQKNLSTEIEIEEKNVRNLLEYWFKLNFENIKFIAYDSRLICINKYLHKVGKVLLDNISNENQIKTIKEKFNNDTDFEIGVEDFKTLPDEIKKKFTF